MKNNNQCKCSQRLSVLLYNTITLLLEEGMTVEELKKEIENRYSFIDFELRNFSIFQNAVKDKKLEEFDEHLSIVDDLLFFISCDILEYLFRVYKNKEVKGYEILMDTGYQIHVNEILVRYSIDDL